MSDIPSLDKTVFDACALAGIPERLDSLTLAEGIKRGGLFTNIVRDKRYARVQGIGDDFIPDTQTYNALGAVYSRLPRSLRDEALGAYLAQLDNVNYIHVQDNHTPFIRDPQVLADLHVVRPAYWPGLEEGERLLTGHHTFGSFAREHMVGSGLFNPKTVQNDFVVAYTLLRADKSSYGEAFAAVCSPPFLERVITGIAALRFGRVRDVATFEQGQARLRELLPREVHPLLEKAEQEKDWVDYTKFP